MPLRFTFRQLEYLVAVGDAGSISLAADKVNVSSPSISAAISQLEAELGVQLFVRKHAHGLSLTPGGRRIYNEAKRLLDNAVALGDLASDIVETARGPLNLGCFVTLAPYLVSSLRKSFESAFPGAYLSVSAANQVELITRLRKAEVDIALTYDLDIPNDISFTGLAELTPQVLLSQDHPLAQEREITLATLADYPMVLLDLPLSRDYFLSLFHTQGLRPDVSERTGDVALMQSLVANGFGYGLLNIRARFETAPDGTPLIVRPLAPPHRPVVIGLAAMDSLHKTRVQTAFEAHVASRISSGQIPGMSLDLP